MEKSQIKLNLTLEDLANDITKLQEQITPIRERLVEIQNRISDIDEPLKSLEFEILNKAWHTQQWQKDVYKIIETIREIKKQE